MLDQAEIDEMRATIEEHKQDTVRIVTITNVRDSTGGTSQTEVLGEPIGARFAPLGEAGTQGEIEVAGRLGMVEPWIVTLPARLAISERDRLRLIRAEDGATVDVEVARVPTPRSEELAVRVLAQEIG